MNASELRGELVKTAQEVLGGNIGIVEASRALRSLLIHLPESADPMFTVIVAVESDTEDVPTGLLRDKVAPEFRERIDAEMSVYIPEILGAFQEACSNIISRYSEASIGLARAKDEKEEGFKRV